MERAIDLRMKKVSRFSVIKEVNNFEDLQDN